MTTIPERMHGAMIRQSIELARYEAGLRAKVISLLDELGRDLVKELADAGLDTPRTDWQRARLRSLLEVAQRRASEVYGEIDGLTRDEYRGLVEVMGDKIVTRMNKAIGADLLQPLNWTNEQIAAIADDSLVFGAKSGEWWVRQNVDLQNAFADQMRMGLLRGESLGELVQRIKGTEGFLGIATRNAEALVTSSAISLANEAHLAAFDANSDIMAGIEWVCTFDKSTCLRCSALSGLRWDNKREPIGHTTPFPGVSLHFRDRCTQVGVTKSWEELATKNKDLARKLDQIPVGQRSSMGGPVPADMTYEGWFKGLDAADQKDILGTGRYDLWKSGKIDLRGLTDQRGNALTLAELGAR